MPLDHQKEALEGRKRGNKICVTCILMGILKKKKRILHVSGNHK